MLKLGVNVDHVATLRQARRALLPDPVVAALLCEAAGAHGITAHLREDRRHIQDEDMRRLAAKVQRLNMEMAVTPEMIKIASKLKPEHCCLVPEKRQELTTEGGLDALASIKTLKPAVATLQKAGIVVSIFIDPDMDQLSAAAESGAEYVELHTGPYSNNSGAVRKKELRRLVKAAEHARQLGLRVNAGHGIDYENIAGILEIPHLEELNIGHSIIARAVIIGIEPAVRDMLALICEYPE
ncbi:MAG: pyridoxine 5'-phosphate synthase [Lentisphaerae bacterium GWF2_52_8]|nr:MAG: pyridoxine 5'-phosphate synthase [Lentisphaerae bacterium GWF2_52_8]